jgi:hypothetical protein
MKEDREKAEKMKSSFASWYKDTQKEWAESQAANEKMKEDIQRRADSAAYEASMRKERLKDIEEELVRDKIIDQMQRDCETEQMEQRRQAYEKRKKEVQIEIETEEHNIQERMNRLNEKWMDTNTNASQQEQQEQQGHSQQADVPRKSRNVHDNVNAETDSNGINAAERVPPESTNSLSKQADSVLQDGELQDDELEQALQEVRQKRAALRVCRAEMRAEEARLWKEVTEMRAERLATESKTQTFRYAFDYCPAPV